MNAIVSPIPTKAYKPATVTPRQRSVMMLSGWSLICLPGTALLLGYYCPTHAHIEHAGGRKLFRFHVQKRTDGEMGTSRSLARARHRAVRAVSSLPPGTDLLTTTVLDTLAPKYAAQTQALRAELPKAGIEANGPKIAMNAGEFEGVQPDHHGL